MSLTWAGIPADQDTIAAQIYTPGKQGTLPPDVLAGARRNAALAIPVNTLQDLLAEIAAGNPVLVFQNLGLTIWPRWHFAVAVAYDLDREELRLHSGRDPARINNLHAFERTWARSGYWAITVTAPNHLPATATEIESLQAAAGVERVGHYGAAITAYQTIAIRWPGSIIARMGIGNSEYRLGNHAAAAAAFREAVTIDSAFAPAWNNLANALKAQGLYEEAAAAARVAVRLDDRAVYRETLEDISAGN
jgi:tetratricopeptide (TPR) repeat protein